MSTIAKPSVRPQTAKSQVKPPMPERRAESARAESAGATEDEIRPLAYRKWQEAGAPAGDGIEFWLAAEMEIIRRRPR